MSNRTIIGINPLASADHIAEQVKRPIVRGSLRVRHAEMIAALVKSQPTVIRYVADAVDLKDRADHIKAIGQAFLAYVTEVVDDTAYVSSIPIDRDVGPLCDEIDEIVGMLRNKADDLAEETMGGPLW